MSLYHIYADESCTGKGHSHLVFGGVIVADHNVSVLNEKMAAWRVRNNMRRELKWVKVSEGKRAEYRGIAVSGIKLSRQRLMCFRSMVVRHADIDYRAYHGGDKDLGFYKLMYQFLLNCFGARMQVTDRALVHLDHRNTTYSLKTLKEVLNNGARKKWNLESPFVNVEAIDSKHSDIMQIADVMMGAIGFHNNQRHLEERACPAKVHIAAEMAKEAGLVTLRTNTPKSMDHFGIWQFRFRARKQAS